MQLFYILVLNYFRDLSVEQLLNTFFGFVFHAVWIGKSLFFHPLAFFEAGLGFLRFKVFDSSGVNYNLVSSDINRGSLHNATEHQCYREVGCIIPFSPVIVNTVHVLQTPF